MRGNTGQFDVGTSLLVEAGRGSRQAFERIYCMYREAVYRFLVRRGRSMTHAILDETVQEVFLRAWANRARFKGNSSAKTYLLTIAANLLRDHRRVPVTSVALVGDAVQDTEAPAPLADVEVRDMADVVHAALSGLTGYQRQAIELICVEGRSFVEAAAQLGCSVKALRRRVESAKHALRDMLCVCGAGCARRGPSPGTCPAALGHVACLRHLYLH